MSAIRFLWLAALLALSSCASLTSTRAIVRPADDAALTRCIAWFDKLDQLTDAARVRDASQHRIPGFPYLRADRYTASFRDQVAMNDALFAIWLERLKQLDAQAREFELANLPDATLPALGVVDKSSALATTRTCADQLASADLASPALRVRLTERVRVPDDYSAWKRALGLYPIATLPFGKGIDGWHRQALALFDAAKLEEASKFERYAPRVSEPGIDVRAILFGLPRDALDIPQLTVEQQRALLAAHAPIYEIETRADFDRFGPLVWRNGDTPEVDVSRPLVYQRLAFTRYKRESLLQLVYTIWFPERPREKKLDLLGGRLDGVVLRVTLDKDGAPLVYDTIHPCGCYHMFFPTARANALPAPDTRTEWAFIPAQLPALAPAQRVAVRIASGTHYIVGVRAADTLSGKPYEFAPDDQLRALPAPGGGTRSAFAPNGLIRGSERGERWLFWPMGIRSSGTMRQWGKHATAFIGRRHFDDARLIEQRFELRGAD